MSDREEIFMTTNMNKRNEDFFYGQETERIRIDVNSGLLHRIIQVNSFLRTRSYFLLGLDPFYDNEDVFLLVK